ncbi:hypothetical protein PG993_015047 [Apiospora rasikravindrae]|uniref:Uncharacterized protein n=1 Tax=Apiospora rasikravindrae TaxID=990691 RepID=A0ABR1RPH2_9PEZI
MVYQSKFFAIDETVVELMLVRDLSEAADGMIQNRIGEGAKTNKMLLDAYDAQHSIDPAQPMWLWYSIVYYKMEEIAKKSTVRVRHAPALSATTPLFVPALALPSPSTTAKDTGKGKGKMEAMAVLKRHGKEEELAVQDFMKKCQLAGVGVSKPEDN